MPDQNTSYEVAVNNDTFSLTREAVNAADIIRRSATSYNVLSNHRSVNATVVSADIAAKHFVITVEGETYDVQVKDELDIVLNKMGFGTAALREVKEIKAPMPGLVLEIAVIEGQELSKGTTILILQAMKMENSIALPADATIKRIAVTAGQAVEKGQLLVELA